MEDSNTFGLALKTVASIPTVRIDREQFLHKELIKHFTAEQVGEAISHNPAYAGIQRTTIDKIAKSSIEFETNKVSLTSFAAGIPGGFAMAATIPADMAQYLAHILRIVQKLIYLYGWESLFDSEGNADDETTNMLTLFVGVMFGVNGAATTISKISVNVAQKASKSIASKALTKGVIYPIVKKIAQALGIKMTKEIFAKGVSKVIPIIGGVASGGLTYVTYKPMAYKLKAHLAQLDLCNVSYYKNVRANDL